jgi:hypothetical protein
MVAAELKRTEDERKELCLTGYLPNLGSYIMRKFLFSWRFAHMR